MQRLDIFVLLVAALFGPLVSTLRADISPEQVRQAIQKGVEYLKRMQNTTDGSWPDYPGYTGGVPSLCTLALLNSGVGVDDPHVQRAIGHLRQIKPETTYAVSLQTMVFCEAEPKKDLQLILRNVRWLESTQITSGPTKGAWSYSGRTSRGDNSNSQFALLALHEAERAGVGVSGQTWRMAKTYWENVQNLNGSWGYREGNSGTGSMTCAGITSLVITADKVRQANAAAEGTQIRCCLDTADDSGKLQQGMAWLGRNFSVTGNPGLRASVWQLYYLYGVERIGRLTAHRFIGSHDWYREGADWLVRNQDGLSGFWKGVGADESNPLIGTSFALLFLSKGRRPILLAKMNHFPGTDWNQHRSDVDNLTRFVESRWDLDLTWQVIDLGAASVDDLLQAPVIYICGGQSPLPDNAQQRQQTAAKLRDYLDRGGFVFAEGYCAGNGFDRGFRQLMELVFPEPEYRLRLLEAEHPIWRADQPVDPQYVRPLLGIEFGCRTSVVYAPSDPPENPRPSLSCLWELSRTGRAQTLDPKVQAQIDAAVAIGVNVLAYATNRELKGKEETFRAQTEARRDDTVDRTRLSIAKLRHPGGCNAAPRALTNLLEAAAREMKIRVDTRESLIYLTDDSLFDHTLAFMHGRNRFSLTDAERARLKTFLERGGTLLADSICASTAFSDSFRAEMKTIFPDKKLEDIPADDPLWTTKYGGFDLKTVTRRDPQAAGGALQAKSLRVPPEMEGIKINGRWGVVFSRYDLSCALEKQDSLQCRGYVREDAARIGLNVVLYSLQ